MKPVDDPPALCGELVPAVRQQPEHPGVVLGSHPTQIGAALGYRGDGLGVDPVGLPAVAPVELARPCGKHRRDVDHDLAGGNELLGEQVAQAVRALDRPGALGPVAGPALEPRQGGLVRRHSQLAQHVAGFIQCHGRVRRLVRIDPDGDHVSLLLKGCSDRGAPRRAT